MTGGSSEGRIVIATVQNHDTALDAVSWDTSGTTGNSFLPLQLFSTKFPIISFEFHYQTSVETHFFLWNEDSRSNSQKNFIQIFFRHTWTEYFELFGTKFTIWFKLTSESRTNYFLFGIRKLLTNILRKVYYEMVKMTIWIFLSNIINKNSLHLIAL